MYVSILKILLHCLLAWIVSKKSVTILLCVPLHLTCLFSSFLVLHNFLFYLFLSTLIIMYLCFFIFLNVYSAGVHSAPWICRFIVWQNFGHHFSSIFLIPLFFSSGTFITDMSDFLVFSYVIHVVVYRFQSFFLCFLWMNAVFASSLQSDQPTNSTPYILFQKLYLTLFWVLCDFVNLPFFSSSYSSLSSTVSFLFLGLFLLLNFSSGYRS